MPGSKIFDVIFGAVALGAAGVLTGLSMGVGFLPAAAKRAFPNDPVLHPKGSGWWFFQQTSLPKNF